MKIITPVVLEFDRIEDKNIDLSGHTLSLVSAHVYLILAYPEWTSPPEDSLFGSRISPIVSGDAKSNRRRTFGRLQAQSVEYLDTESAQAQGYQFLLFFYKQWLLGSFGFQGSRYRQLLQEPNREYRRSFWKIPLGIADIHFWLRRPAPHVVEEYRKLVNDHLGSLQ